MENEFLENYFLQLKNLLDFKKEDITKLIAASKLMKEAQKKNKKTLIFGNGGSAAIASHFSVDLTKNAKVRCTNYNESDLLTCFSNDFGYENWVQKTIEFYADKDDILILISASGNSQNMINAAQHAKKFGIKSIITFTGNKDGNKLQKMGDLNFWVNSSSFNHIENVHQILLLSIVDLISGKSESNLNQN